MKTKEETIQRKYQVFISSTFRDLAEQRRLVLDAVVDRGHIPVAMERFGAEDNTVPSVIKKAIEASQIYMLIIGFRYGEIVKEKGISFSELEYEIARKENKVVVPFLLADSEVTEERLSLEKELAEAKNQAEKLREDTLEGMQLKERIGHLEDEIKNEAKLQHFREIAKAGKLYQMFSLRGGRDGFDRFDKHMVLKALLQAEKKAAEIRLAGWIREPKGLELIKTLEAVSDNRFLVDVVAAMGKFEALRPRIHDQENEKHAAASFFADRYLQSLLNKKVNLFFESGSTVAYVAQSVGEGLGDHRDELTISTNNVLAYLIFWLVHRVRCALFPWGSPEQRYGAVFGPLVNFVPEAKKPSFPPEPLSFYDKSAIKALHDDLYSPAKWTSPALLLGALSGLQLSRDIEISNCLGPHVGSPRNKVFKRFMYATELPLMLFMAANKIDSQVNQERCHFILEQKDDQELSWEVFYRNRPLAFCVGCENSPDEVQSTARRFEELGFEIIRAQHKTRYTAFIARNRRFIDSFESALNIP